MTGIIFDIKRFTIHDGPGIRTTVFFKGCPLRCWWCHNPESIANLPEKIKINPINSDVDKLCESEFELFGRTVTSEEILTEIKKDQIFYDESGGGVTFSGGEPLQQFEFLKEILILCKKDGIHTVVDTSGYAAIDNLKEIYKYVDLFLFDLKLIDNYLHTKYTDVSNELIHQNLQQLSDMGCKVVIRIPLIPNLTDTEKNINDVISLVQSLNNIKRIDLLPYNEIAISKFRRFNLHRKIGSLKTQSAAKLNELKTAFKKINTEINLRG